MRKTISGQSWRELNSEDKALTWSSGDVPYPINLLLESWEGFCFVFSKKEIETMGHRLEAPVKRHLERLTWSSKAHSLTVAFICKQCASFPRSVSDHWSLSSTPAKEAGSAFSKGWWESQGQVHSSTDLRLFCTAKITTIISLENGQEGISLQIPIRCGVGT